MQLDIAGSNLWARSEKLLWELDRHTETINTAEGLFEELINVVEAQIAVQAEHEQESRSRPEDNHDNYMADRNEIIRLQCVVEEKDSEIVKLRAECGELRAKNDFLCETNTALSCRIAALQNEILDTSTINHQGNGESQRMAMLRSPDVISTIVVPSHEQAVDTVEERLPRSTWPPESPATSCSVTFFTPSLNSPAMYNYDCKVDQSILSLELGLQNAWSSSPRPVASGQLRQTGSPNAESEVLDEPSSPLARYPGCRRKKKITFESTSSAGSPQRLKLPSDHQLSMLNVDDLIAISDDDDSESLESHDDRESGGSARQDHVDPTGHNDPNGMDCEFSTLPIDRDGFTGSGHTVESCEDAQNTVHIPDMGGFELNGTEDHSGTSDSRCRSGSVLSTIVVGSGQTPKPHRRGRQSVTNPPPTIGLEHKAAAEKGIDMPTGTEDSAHGQVKQRTMASYEKYGVRTALVFSYTPEVFDPRSIDMRSVWKKRSILDGRSWKRLNISVEDVVRFLPEDSNITTAKKEGLLLKRICFGQSDPAVAHKVQDVVLLLHSRSECSRDEARMLKFECYSVLAILRSLDLKEYERVAQKLEGYQVDVLHVYQSMHAVLDQLGTIWHGMHTPLLLYLCKLCCAAYDKLRF